MMARKLGELVLELLARVEHLENHQDRQDSMIMTHELKIAIMEGALGPDEP